MNVTTIISGITELDNLVKGFRPSELILIGARPSVGKTLFALSIIANIAVRDKKPVGLFSLEMTAEAVIDRLIHGEGTNIDSEDELTEITDKINKAPLYIEVTPNISLPYLIVKALRMRAVKRVEIIFIDYLTLITLDKKTRAGQRKEISYSLKDLAKELEIPIVVLVQVKRNDKGLPTLADIRGGDSIAKGADTIIFLHKQVREDSETELIVAKHRA